MLGAVILIALAGFVLVMTLAARQEEKEVKFKQKVERQLFKGQETKFSLLDFLGLAKLRENIRDELISAGSNKDPEALILTVFILVTILFVFGILMGLGIISLILPLIMVVVLYLSLSSMAVKRINKIEEEMKYTLSDMTASLRVKNSIEAAIRNAIQTGNEPLKSELTVVLDLVTTGVSIDDALNNFAQRVNSPIITAWVDNLLFSRQAGTDLADACKRTAQQIKSKMKLKKERKIAGKSAKSTMAGIMIILAITIFMMIKGSNDFIAAIKTPLGKGIVGYAVLSFTLTTIYINRQINK